MAGCLVVTLEGGTAQSMLKSLRIEIFELLELHLGVDL